MYYTEYRDIKAKKKLCKTAATKTNIDKAIIVKRHQYKDNKLVLDLLATFIEHFEWIAPITIVLLSTLNIFFTEVNAS